MGIPPRSKDSHHCINDENTKTSQGSDDNTSYINDDEDHQDDDMHSSDGSLSAQNEDESPYTEDGYYGYDCEDSHNNDEGYEDHSYGHDDDYDEGPDSYDEGPDSHVFFYMHVILCDTQSFLYCFCLCFRLHVCFT